MTTTFVTRTPDLMPALQPAQLSVCPQGLSASSNGTAMPMGIAMGQSAVVRPYAAVVRTGLFAVASNSSVVERHVAVIGTRQVVSPVVGTAVSGAVLFGKDDAPALRTWRPPV